MCKHVYTLLLLLLLLYVVEQRGDMAARHSELSDRTPLLQLPEQRPTLGEEPVAAQRGSGTAQLGQVEHSRYVDFWDLSQCVRLQRALSSLLACRSIFCSRCHARAFLWIHITGQGTGLAVNNNTHRRGLEEDEYRIL